MLPTVPEAKRTVRSAMSSVVISRLETRSTTALTSVISPHSHRMKSMAWLSSSTQPPPCLASAM